MSARFATAIGSLALLLSIACGGSFRQGRAAAASGWLQVETSHFNLYTNLPEPSARDLAQSLEEARAALLLLAWGGAAGPEGHIEVVVFARQSEFELWRGDAMAVGELAAYPGLPRLLVFTPGRDAGLSRIAVHELAHELSRWFIPLQPVWFSEGLASMLEGLTFDRSTGHARLGALTEDRVKWVQTIPSTEELLFAHESLQLDVRKSAAFYSGVWLLTHYLRNHHNAAFGRFQRELARLRDWREAWAVHLADLTPAQLDVSLKQYVANGEFSVREATIEVPPFTVAVRRLPAAEQQGMLAKTALLMGNRPLAKKLRLEAQRLDAAEVAAAEVELFEATPVGMSDGSSNSTRLAELALQVTKAHPDRAGAWRMLAQFHPSEVLRNEGLVRAGALEPHHPSLRWLLAWQALERGRAEEALAHAHFVLRRWPLTLDVIRLQVVALAANGGCDVASEVMRTAHTLYAWCETKADGKSTGCMSELRKVADRACPGAPSKSKPLPDVFIKLKSRRNSED